MKANEGILATCMLVILPLMSQGSERSVAGPRFALKIGGGIGYLAVGDYNTSQRSQNEARKDYAQRHGYGLSGEYKYIHLGIDLEAEAYMYLTPRLAVILGSGYIRAGRGPERNRMTLEWTPSQYISVFSEDASISAVPIFLGLKYEILLADKIGFFLKGCLGYYFAKFSRLSREDVTGPDPGYDWYTYKEDSTSSGFGFQGGLGFEYRANRNLAFAIEGAGRYAKMTDFKAEHRDAYSYGLSRSGSGTLYYYEWQDLPTGKWYPSLTVWKSAPSDPTMRNVREAVVDLSGFALRAGIKIYL